MQTSLMSIELRYRIHLYIMFGGTGGITVVAWLLGVMVATPPHFTIDSPHKLIGLLMLILMILQIVLGYVANALWYVQSSGQSFDSQW